MSDFRFGDKGTFWFVGTAGSGPFFQDREENWATPLWEELFRREEALPPNPPRRPYLSLCHARETEFTFYGGFEVPAGATDVPEGMVRIRVPAHTYAVGRVVGDGAAIASHYEALAAWAEAEGRPVNRAILWLEVHPERPVLDPDGPFDYEVWLPVR